MSTKDELCREIAANLRDAADGTFPLGVFTPELLSLLGIGEGGEPDFSDAKDVLRLAALIDRPTCRNVHEGREFECSECGITWHLLDKEDPCEEWTHVRNPPHCPSCGAEVVR